MLRFRALRMSVAVLLLAGCAGGGSQNVPIAGDATTSSTIQRQSAAFALDDAAVKHNTWKRVKAMPTARTGAGAGTIGTTIYVVGGFDGTNPTSVNEVYDSMKNTWTTAAPMPTPRWVFASAVVGKTFYAIGGELGGPNNYHQTNVVEAYDSTTNSWATKAPMPTIRNSVNAVVLNGDIYVVGGYSNSGGRLANMEQYNPATNKWTMKKPMNVAKSGIALGVVGKEILAADGLSNNGVTNDNESFTVARNTWATLAPATVAQNGSCAGAIAETLYAAGGADSGDNALSNTYAYGVKTNAWASKASMPLAVVSAAATVEGGKLFCIGGGNHGNPSGALVYNDVQVYQP